MKKPNRPALVRDGEKIESIEVLLSNKQHQMVVDATNQIQLAEQARRTIIDTLTAGSDADGVFNWSTVNRDGKFFLRLTPPEAPAPPA